MKENWEKLIGQAKFRFDLICGVSAGALNGILTACQRFEDMEALWQFVKKNGGEEIYTSNYITNRGKIQLSSDQLKKDLLPDFHIDAGTPRVHGIQ